MRADLIGRRSSRSSSSPVTGSLPFSSMYFSISRFSKTVPVFLETTGSSGASPETVKGILDQYVHLMIDLEVNSLAQSILISGLVSNRRNCICDAIVKVRP